MEMKYLEVMVDFSELVTNPISPGKETSVFHDTISSEFAKFAEKFALKFPEEYPALKETLLRRFCELYPYKATDYTLKDLEKPSSLGWVVVSIYEGLIVQNLKKSILNFFRQHVILPSIGQVFTLYNYEADFQSILQAFPNTEEDSDNSMSWILQEYNFMLILINYFDPDNAALADKNGVLKFYFSLHHAY